jgi:transposase-like protein
VAKKRVGRYLKEFRRIAVERLKSWDNIMALSRELGVHRRLLYKWRDQLDPAEIEELPPQNSRESTLRKEVTELTDDRNFTSLPEDKRTRARPN